MFTTFTDDIFTICPNQKGNFEIKITLTDNNKNGPLGKTFKLPIIVKELNTNSSIMVNSTKIIDENTSKVKNYKNFTIE